MKRRVLFLFLIFAFTVSSLTGCKRAKEFSHCELTLVLDDSFVSEESEEYDLLLTDGEIIVTLIRISFPAALATGIPDTYTAKGFAAFFMHESAKSESLLMHGDVPYYTYTEKYSGSSFYHTVTFYRSYSAYFVVGYSVAGEGDDAHLNRFLEYSQKAYFNDAPTLNAEE